MLVYNEYKKRAKRSSIDFDLDPTRFKAMATSDCWYCGQAPQERSRFNKFLKNPASKSFMLNGIDRIDNTKGYVDGNVVACCSMCNRAKGVITSDEFTKWFTRAADFWKANRSGK